MDWDFRPHPLLRNGHLQSVVGIHLPFETTPHQAALHVIPTVDPTGRFDDERLALHEDRPDRWQKGDSIVLLIHGLAGCHQSTYMVRTAQRLLERGHAVFRLDMRGCGAGEGLARQPAHCGRGEDVHAALQYIAELHDQSPIQAVGFSLGGTLILNLLADLEEIRIGGFFRALAICPPIDLFDVERRFAQPGGRVYERFFVKLLWRQICRRWQIFPELAPTRMPRRPRRLRQIDETVIAPGGGFSSADEYYEKTQPGPKLTAIQMPVDIVAAADDPVVPTTPLLQYEASSLVDRYVVPGGGHLGFVGLSGVDPNRRWLDWRIADWADEGIATHPTATTELIRTV